ncbi:MAG: hypothetical protein ACR2RV_21310, partial [Verrucomicrobiales bacterium]
RLGGNNLPVQRWFEGQGIEFPAGSFALFEPNQSMLVIRHRREVHDRIVNLVEPVIPAPRPQILCTQRLELRRGDERREMKAPSVVTTSGQRAMVEIIREQTIPGVKNSEPEVTELGLRWEVEPVVHMKGPKIEVSGSVMVRVPKGENPIDFMQDGSGWKFDPKPRRKPDWDEYRAPFNRELKPGGSIEIPLGEVKDRRLLRRLRRSKGSLVGILTVSLIDPSGGAVEKHGALVTEKDLRLAFPKFKMVPRDLRHGNVELARRMGAAAVAWSDLREIHLAEECARTALALSPDDERRYEVWKELSAQQGQVAPVDDGAGDTWVVRSYRLRAPLLPERCLAGDEASAPALREFLSECGMGFPNGATAALAEDRMAVQIRNRLDEIKKFEAGLGDRIWAMAGGTVSASVEVITGLPEGEKIFELAPSSLGIAGIFTDEQYKLWREQAVGLGAERHVDDSKRILGRGRQIDVLEDLGIAEVGLLTKAQADLIAGTIKAEFVMQQFGKGTPRGDHDQKAESQLAMAVTIWDGQWVELRGMTEDGPVAVFARMQIVRD